MLLDALTLSPKQEKNDSSTRERERERARDSTTELSTGREHVGLRVSGKPHTPIFYRTILAFLLLKNFKIGGNVVPVPLQNWNQLCCQEEMIMVMFLF